MYGYFTSAILIFLTHPGVAYNWFSPGVWGGMFQAFFVLLLQAPSDGKASFSTTMAIIYWVCLFLWAYIKVRLMLAG